MCFSAEASFVASAVLLPAGVYCTTVAARKRPACLPLAVIPIVFSLQQFCEGFVWVGLERGDADLVAVSSLLFLAVALGFWPFWVPFSLLFMEGRRRVKWWLSAVALFGMALGCALYVPLLLNPEEWLDVSVVHHSLRYNPRGLPVFSLAQHELWDFAYGAAVLAPFFIAPANGRFVVFRVLLAVSVGVTFLAFHDAFVSVWCFFAALLSALLCFTFSRLDEW